MLLEDPKNRFVDLIPEQSDEIVRKFVEIAGKYTSDYRENDACAVCGSSESHGIVDQIFRMVNKKLYMKSGRKLLMCDRCGSIRVPVLMSRDYYFDYLNNFYDVVPRGVSHDMPLKALTRTIVLKSAAALTGKEIGSVLEVSSFEGSTLASLLASFPGLRVKGVEPTVGAVDFAEKAFPQLAGKMDRKSFEQYEFQDGEVYDGVIFSLSFSMVCEPRESLRKLRSHVSPGGIVLMSEGGYLSDIQTAMQRHWPTRHYFAQKLFMYTYQSLRYLMAEFGFRHLMSQRFDHPQMAATIHAFTPDDTITPEEVDLQSSKVVSEGSLALFRSLAPTEDAIKKYLIEVG